MRGEQQILPTWSSARPLTLSPRGVSDKLLMCGLDEQQGGLELAEQSGPEGGEQWHKA